jgi:membrane protease YdiL (CAAX protease family)
MMQSLRMLLFDPRMPLWRWCLIAWPLAMIPSMLLVMLLHTALGWWGVDAEALSPPVFAATWRMLLLVVVVAPLLETLLLAAGVWALGRVLRSRAVVVLLSALAWGLLHGVQSPLWFFGTVWSFYVFSAGYVAWRRVSGGHAFAAAAVPHALINLTVMALLFTAEHAGAL